MNYKIRPANKSDLECIYLMAYDTWGQGISKQEYLNLCDKSKKYQCGIWYVFLENDQLVSSLIVYSSGFSLPMNSYGIGSISTRKDLRNKGFASFFVSRVVNLILSDRNSIYLHSDIGCSFYEKFGFKSIDGSSCMVKNKDNFIKNTIPDYF